MLKRKGGVNGLLNNVKKNCTFLTCRLPLTNDHQDNCYDLYHDCHCQNHFHRTAYPIVDLLLNEGALFWPGGRARPGH